MRALEALGFTYQNGTWLPAVPAPWQALPLIAEADAMHGVLMRHADALVGCIEGSDEEADLKATVDAIEAYEAKRWPLGKEPGGKA